MKIQSSGTKYPCPKKHYLFFWTYIFKDKKICSVCSLEIGNYLFKSKWTMSKHLCLIQSNCWHQKKLCYFRKLENELKLCDHIYLWEQLDRSVLHSPTFSPLFKWYFLFYFNEIILYRPTWIESLPQTLIVWSYLYKLTSYTLSILNNECC